MAASVPAAGSEHLITQARLAELDALYDAYEDRGILGRRATRWNDLVEALRAIRRLVEAGVVVKLEGTTTVLTTWQEFYA